MENIVVPNKREKKSSINNIHSTTGNYPKKMVLQNDWKFKTGGNYVKQVLN